MKSSSSTGTPASAESAIGALLAEMGDEIVLAEVHLRRGADGFELRHAADRASEASGLRTLAVAELRALAQTTERGAFRPIKAAPTLRRGWRVWARTPGDVERALDQLYPGGLADWRAARQDPPPVTDYREFTGRQTGMYRITTSLTDEQAARMIRAACDARFCLKRRLWTVGGLPADAASEKSAIPCLEPCAVLLEFARQAAKIEREPAMRVMLAPSEIETLRAALEMALSAGERAGGGERIADFGAAGNPRRLRMLLEKSGTWTTSGSGESGGV